MSNLFSDIYKKLSRIGRIILSAERGGGSYLSATFNQFFKGSTTIEGGGLEGLEDLNNLQVRSYNGYRNNHIAKAIIDKKTDLTIHRGLRLQVASDNERKSEEIERQFYRFVHEADIFGTYSFEDLQRNAYRQMLLSGDAFLVIDRKNNEKLKIRVLEGCHIRSDNESTPYGMALDRVTGKINKIIFKSSEDDVEHGVPCYDEQGNKQVFQLINGFRSDQLRGVPFLTQVFQPLDQLNKYIYSEIEAAEKASRISTYLKADQNIFREIFKSRRPDSDNQTSQGLEQNWLDIKKGLEKHYVLPLPPGTEITTHDAKRPPQSFPAFVDKFLTLIAAPAGLSKDILLSSYSSSYSASQASRMDVWEKVEIDRKSFIFQFLEPIWRFFLETHPDVDSDTPHYWMGKSLSHIDPLKQAKANSEKLKMGITTRKSLIEQENGMYSKDEIFRELSHEEKAIQQRRINKTEEKKKEEI